MLYLQIMPGERKKAARKESDAAERGGGGGGGGDQSQGGERSGENVGRNSGVRGAGQAGDGGEGMLPTTNGHTEPPPAKAIRVAAGEMNGAVSSHHPTQDATPRK